MKGTGPDLGGDLKERIGYVGHTAGQHDVGRDLVLVAIGAEGVDLALASGLEDAQAGGVGVVEQQISAPP